MKQQKWKKKGKNESKKLKKSKELLNGRIDKQREKK